jgi:hypothetical protein
MYIDCMGLKKLSILVFFLCIAAAAARESCLLSENWNNRIKVVTTEQGEKLAIAAVCAEGDRIYLYQRSDRTLVCYDTAGRYVRTVALESIGRNTYVGDDFVVRDTAVLFVNSIDRTLERFSLATGRHSSSLALPDEPFKSAPQRSRRIVNRIFLAQGTILLGNSYLLAEYDPQGPGLSRRAAVQKASVQGRFALVTRLGNVTARPNGALTWAGRIVRPPKSAIECTGKAFFVFNTRLFTIVQDGSGLRIVELK